VHHCCHADVVVARLWQGSKPGLTQLYLSAMDAIHAVAPHILFFLEVSMTCTVDLHVVV